MATNIKRYLQGHFAMPVVVTNPATPVSGDPVRYGEMTGIALTDEGEGGNAATFTTVEFGACVVSVSVKGIDDSGNSAVAAGDSIFYVDADTPKLSKKASGYFFGFAIGTVNSAATATIEVLKTPAGSFIGTVNTGDLAAGAVTAAKLSTTLKTGFIPVPLASLLEGDATNIVAALGPATDPVLDMTNGDTDSALRVLWAATSVVPVVFQVPIGPDLDEAADVVIHLRAAMEAANDTPVIAADSYFNEGDTKVEDASAAITGTAFAEYVITIAAADVPAGAQTLTCELTPAAHGTDDLYVTAIWVEYTRA
jgi:predicted RecA/RadA family phage recombinase